MSDWFTNPSSELSDALWRTPTPMQRQADAVVMWAELTGKHASGCGSHGPKKPKKKTEKKASAASKDGRSLLEKAYVKAYPLGTKESRQAIADKHTSLKKKAS